MGLWFCNLFLRLSPQVLVCWSSSVYFSLLCILYLVWYIAMCAIHVNRLPMSMLVTLVSFNISNVGITNIIICSTGWTMVVISTATNHEFEAMSATILVIKQFNAVLTSEYMWISLVFNVLFTFICSQENL